MTDDKLSTAQRCACCDLPGAQIRCIAHFFGFDCPRSGIRFADSDVMALGKDRQKDE